MRKIKQAAVPLTEANLPHDRQEVFWDCFKSRCRVLFGLGILLLLFILPLFISLIMRDSAFLNLRNIPESTQADAYAIDVMYCLINVVLFPIAGIGFAGAFRVIRNLVWGEPIFFKEDFADGIKKNGRQFALVFFLAGIIILVNTFMSGMLDIAAIVRFLPTGVAIVYFLPVGMFALSIINVYNVKMKEFVQIGTGLYIKFLFKNLLALVICLSPLFLLLIKYIFIKYILLAISIVFIMPLSIMGWFLYSCHVFDATINKEQYPEIYDKGIYRIGENNATN